MHDRKSPIMNLFNLKEDWNVLYHQPIRNQEKLTNQKAEYKKKQPITTIIITDFSYISPWLIPSSFFPNSYDVLLREMRQAVYREEKPVTSYEDLSAVNRGLYLWCMWKRFWQRRYQKQTYDDPPDGSNGVWADLFMWGMRQELSRADNRKRHEATHSYSLTCRVCGQYFNRMDNLARHRAQHERPEAKQRLPMKRPPTPEPWPVTKQRRTVLPPAKTHQEKNRVARGTGVKLMFVTGVTHIPTWRTRKMVN
jgi:hypothetical protein